MIFNSVTYILFLAAAVLLYWWLPTRGRLWMLFAGSLMFYGFWRWEFLPLMLFSTVVDYVVSLALGRTSDATKRKLLLLTSLTVNLGLLFVYKYLIFFTDSVCSVARLCGLDVQAPGLKIVLPMGISFYTFQTISYTIDVYRRFIKPERDFLLFANYVVFFPQLVAGPILRAQEVIHQLANRPPFRIEDIGCGLRRILYGLFLKCVLADNISGMVEAGFTVPASQLGALDVWTLAFLFGFQIYFDFAAYSHIALGSARLMGIHFSENFNFPYLSSSPKEFWKRWHISLSSWIRDYLYLPLAGAKVHDHSTGGLSVENDRQGSRQEQGQPRRYLALFLTWIIMGLWHGANWTFVLWGFYHAVCVFTHRIVSPAATVLPAFVRRHGGWAVTLATMMLSWVLFRAEDLRQAFTMYGKLLRPAEYLHMELWENTYLVAALLLGGMVLVYFAWEFVAPRLARIRPLWFALESVAFTVIAAGVFVFLRPQTQFIYFQF